MRKNSCLVLLRLGLVLAFSLPVKSMALELPPHTPVPGGVAVVDLGVTGGAPPNVRYRDRAAMVVPHAGGWWAVVGIPLDAEPGLQTLSLTPSGANGGPPREVPFRVEGKDYRAQYITLQNNNYVEPDAQTQQRIRRDAEIRGRALNSWSDAVPATLRFVKPVQGRYSSEFGLRRFFNKKPRRPHSGLDIAAPTGTPIRAPAPGEVVAGGDYFFNGKTVFIDHGQGLVTMYCHLDSIAVAPGQRVKTGDKLGTVGSTGRATGPHLHWSVSLNGTMVEPKVFLREP